MRVLALSVLASLATVGCATKPDYGLVLSEPYFVAERTGEGDCFTRVINDVARDQICIWGDFVRYRDYPIVDFTPMPNHVQALFHAIEPGEGIWTYK